MRITKIINNNVVSARNEENHELMILGKGIGFQKKIGEAIDEERINKIFKLENNDVKEKFKRLLYEIPVEYMELSEEIILKAQLKTGKKLNESIYILLTDHIYFAVERHEKKLDIKNVLLWETRRFYKDEFEVGLEALKMIREKFNVNLPIDEAAFIALHIINAQLDEEIPTIMNMTHVIQEILNIVKYHFRWDFDEDSLYFYRFITHLKFFSQRLFQNLEESTSDNMLYEVVKNQYQSAHACTEKIKTFIEKNYNYLISNDEMLYLTIHIERICQEKIKKDICK